MKNGTAYAARLGRAFTKQRAGFPNPVVPEPDDPLRRLAIGVLGVERGDDEASRALDSALKEMVDWNEMRVSNGPELNQATGNRIPNGVKRCQQLIRALQAVYDRENTLSLDRLHGIARREARHYLEELDGLDEYAVASIILWSLGGHAIPVNDKLLKSLRDADLVHPEATRAEIQAFLERHVGASQAKEFCLIMQSYKPVATKRKTKAKTKTVSKKKTVSEKN